MLSSCMHVSSLNEGWLLEPEHNDRVSEGFFNHVLPLQSIQGHQPSALGKRYDISWGLHDSHSTESITVCSF